MITQAEQRFLDALNVLAAEQGLSFAIPEGYARLNAIRMHDDGGPNGYTRRLFSVDFDWISPRQGERYYDVDSTATDVRERHELGGPLALIGAGVDQLAKQAAGGDSDGD